MLHYEIFKDTICHRHQSNRWNGKLNCTFLKGYQVSDHLFVNIILKKIKSNRNFDDNITKLLTIFTKLVNDDIWYNFSDENVIV